MATTSDIRLPAEALRTLRRSLVRQVGPETATRALQEAGHAAGDRLVEIITEHGDLADLPADAFWDRLDQELAAFGWGSIEHQTPHPGVGALVARDWFEVGESRACPFTTGVFARLLGHAAGGDVAVMQVPCESDEPGCVRFLFGSADVLEQVYAGLREGGGLEAGLAALG